VEGVRLSGLPTTYTPTSYFKHRITKNLPFSLVTIWKMVKQIGKNWILIQHRTGEDQKIRNTVDREVQASLSASYTSSWA
jgi:hypothetical protein